MWFIKLVHFSSFSISDLLEIATQYMWLRIDRVVARNLMCVCVCVLGEGGGVWFSVISRDLREERQLNGLTNLSTKASTYNLFFQSKINNLCFAFFLTDRKVTFTMANLLESTVVNQGYQVMNMNHHIRFPEREYIFYSVILPPIFIYLIKLILVTSFSCHFVNLKVPVIELL